MERKADIGLIGLAVMGENLALNMESRGFTVTVFNRTTEKVDRFLENRGKGKNFIGAHSMQELAESLKVPRKVFMMVRAGSAVDNMIDQLLAVLEPGDILIDGGNSNYQDTMRRCEMVESKGLLYVGSGVSGGEEGALTGPALMPGGSAKAWESIRPVFEAISAKAGDGRPCCSWIGDNGAGHYVKMVHNGIEYGDMQLICEAYQLMKDVPGMDAPSMAEVFASYNKTELDSYLIEITANILAYKEADGSSLVDHILDVAGQKGTGKWTGIAALNEGVPLTLIGEAVFARCLSSQKEERVAASAHYTKEAAAFEGDKEAFIEDIRKALFASKIISYTQGFTLLRQAAKTYDWNLNYGEIALSWRGGCIIRSVFLNMISEAYAENPDLVNLLMSPFFEKAVKDALPSWRRVVVEAVKAGVPVPAMTSALAYFDGYTTENLPANLLQGQRDYFGAHTYERKDAPRGEHFHTNWTGHGGDTSASTYDA